MIHWKYTSGNGIDVITITEEGTNIHLEGLNYADAFSLMKYHFMPKEINKNVTIEETIEEISPIMRYKKFIAWNDLDFLGWQEEIRKDWDLRIHNIIPIVDNANSVGTHIVKGKDGVDISSDYEYRVLVTYSLSDKLEIN